MRTFETCEAIADFLDGHALIEAWKDLAPERVTVLAMREKGLTNALAVRVAKAQGILVTVMAARGRNTAKTSERPKNDTTFLVTLWDRPTLRAADDALPEAEELLDDLMLACAEWKPEAMPHCNFALRVETWGYVPDATYFAAEIVTTALVALRPAIPEMP